MYCLPYVSPQVITKCASISIVGCTCVTLMAEWIADDPSDSDDSGGDVYPKQTVDFEHQPTALLAALPLLQAIAAPADTALELNMFDMSTELPAAVAAVAEPGWKDLCLTLDFCGTGEEPGPVRLPHLHTLKYVRGVLTDAVHSALVARTTSVDNLCVLGAKLETTLPDGAEVPWRQITPVHGLFLPQGLQSAYALRHTECVWNIEVALFYLQPDMVSRTAAHKSIHCTPTLHCI